MREPMGVATNAFQALVWAVILGINMGRLPPGSALNATVGFPAVMLVLAIVAAIWCIPSASTRSTHARAVALLTPEIDTL